MLEYCVSLYNIDWLLSAEYEPGRTGIGRSCSPLDDRSRDNRLSQDIVIERVEGRLKRDSHQDICFVIVQRKKKKD